MTIQFVNSVQTVMEIKDPRLQNSKSAKIVTDAIDCLCFVDTSAGSVSSHSSGSSGTGSFTTHQLFLNTAMLLPPGEEITPGGTAAAGNLPGQSSLLPPSVALGVALARALCLDPSLAATLALLLAQAAVSPPPSPSPTASILSGVSDPVPASAAQLLLSRLRISTDPVSLRERVRGAPGSIVTEADRRMLELKPFRAYRIGEIVAFESSTVTEGGDGDEQRSTGEVSAVMVYGKVLSIEEDHSQSQSHSHSHSHSDKGTVEGGGGGGEVSLGMKKIIVRTSSVSSGSSGASAGSGGSSSCNTASFLPTSLYSFKSARDVSLHTPSATCTATATPPPSRPSSSSSSSSSVSAEGKSTALSSTLKGGSGDSSEKQKQKQQQQQNQSTASNSTAVSQEEIVLALGGLLHRAGIPMTLEKEVCH